MRLCPGGGGRAVTRWDVSWTSLYPYRPVLGLRRSPLPAVGHRRRADLRASRACHILQPGSVLPTTRQIPVPATWS